MIAVVFVLSCESINEATAVTNGVAKEVPVNTNPIYITCIGCKTRLDLRTDFVTYITL